jgi:hypothetical protein
MHLVLHCSWVDSHERSVMNLAHLHILTRACDHLTGIPVQDMWLAKEWDLMCLGIMQPSTLTTIAQMKSSGPQSTGYSTPRQVIIMVFGLGERRIYSISLTHAFILTPHVFSICWQRLRVDQVLWSIYIGVVDCSAGVRRSEIGRKLSTRDAVYIHRFCLSMFPVRAV